MVLEGFGLASTIFYLMQFGHFNTGKCCMFMMRECTNVLVINPGGVIVIFVAVMLIFMAML